MPAYRVVRCDFRGYGETPVPQGPHNDAEDVLDLADELGAGPVAVVGASYGGKVALEIAARWPQQVTALALVSALMPGHEPTDALRGFWHREGELIEAGDIAGAVELNVTTWLGPEADEPTRERVRLMQRHAFEVQLAAPEEYEPAVVAVDLGVITAPSLVVSGAQGPAGLPADRGQADRDAARCPAGGAALGRAPAHAGTTSGTVRDADRLLAGDRPGRVSNQCVHPGRTRSSRRSVISGEAR